MFRNYFKVGLRNLIKNQGFSLINISGLAIGMSVVMFIGLWMYDELSFNSYHTQHESIAQVWNGGTDSQTGDVWGGYAMQFPVGGVLKSNYPQYFKNIVMSWWLNDFVISHNEDKFKKKGLFIEPAALEMLSLKMLKGNYKSLEQQHSIVISKSFAEAVFGNADPMNKVLRIDNRMEVEITGVYEDIPRNSKFGEAKFFSTWQLWIASNQWLENASSDWDNRMTNTYVELQPNVSFEEANAAIHDLYYKSVPKDFFATIKDEKPFVQLVPMDTWHLYSEFENGKPASGRITFVWLFGIVGGFVLVLACINFINMNTARSEKRAREVGVRKAIGSGRKELIVQFLSESYVVVLISFFLSTIVVALLLPSFNVIADKDIKLPFDQPVFWLSAMAFISFTGFLAGTYPALYLSSLQPVKVLKGMFQGGRSGALPRKALVVIQFTVSVVLIVGTLVVYQQIQHARNRPIGYTRDGLLSMELRDPGLKSKINVLRTELLASGVVKDVATSSAPITDIWNKTSGYMWPGKDPALQEEFVNNNVTLDFGKTIQWEVIAGRDFSSEIATDTVDAIIINEAAVKYMGLKNPIGEKITDVDEFGTPKWSRVIIGVVKDVVVSSPYEPVMQTIYYQDEEAYSMLHMRITPSMRASDAISIIRNVIAKVSPGAMFDYKFVDDEFAAKFSQEQRVGQLAAIFATLTIFISCLGLFGLAAFMAERRTKEIGIRKIMGASVLNLWRMLSTEFIVLVIISCAIALPISYFMMDKWLDKFSYRTNLSISIFLTACLCAILITLITVSFQSIKAALMNPVKSLRSE